MPNIKKRPTEVIATRIPKSLLPFLKIFENRNDFILSLIENSKEYKEYLQKQTDEKNQSKLF